MAQLLIGDDRLLVHMAAHSPFLDSDADKRLSAFRLVKVMLLFWLTLLIACEHSDRQGSGSLAGGTMRLPRSLHELSGMTAVDANTLACVQDELGIVFFVDLSGQQPVRPVPFGKKGDYEGIALAAGSIWILRSDGKLQKLTFDGQNLRVEKSIKVPFDGEFEGLCFDPASEQLLVLPKGPVEGKRREKIRRRVLACDAFQGTVLSKPFLTLRVDKIEEQIEELDLAAPRRTTSKGNIRVDLKLLSSELLVLPDGDLLLLSPKDHLLLRLDRSGDVVATQDLDMELLPQPEAMALLPDGRLLIGSEGRGRSALIAVVAIPE